MNSSGRIFGGLLIAIATAWILNIAGVLPFSNRTNNQLATADRTPVSDANAQRTNAQPSQTSGRTAPLNTQPTSTTRAQFTVDSFALSSDIRHGSAFLG